MQRNRFLNNYRNYVEDYLLQNRLELAIVIEASKRVWRQKENSPEGLKRSEFIFPISEPNKFKVTKRRLSYAFKKVIEKLGIFDDTGKTLITRPRGKKSHGKVKIFKWYNNDFITIDYEMSQPISSEFINIKKIKESMNINM